MLLRWWIFFSFFFFLNIFFNEDDLWIQRKDISVWGLLYERNRELSIEHIIQSQQIMGSCQRACPHFIISVPLFQVFMNTPQGLGLYLSKQRTCKEKEVAWCFQKLKALPQLALSLTVVSPSRTLCHLGAFTLTCFFSNTSAVRSASAESLLKITERANMATGGFID